jgi:hypothetical protein
MILVKLLYQEQEEDVLYLIDENRIETMPVSDTYNNDGLLLGSYGAGDSIEILSENLVAFANKYEEENDSDFEWEIGQLVEAYYNTDLFDKIKSNKQLKQDKDYKLYQLTCKGYNYWNGKKYQSVILEDSFDNSFVTHEIIDEDELLALVNKAVKEKEYVKEENGVIFYSYKLNEEETKKFDLNKITFFNSCWQQDSWYEYKMLFS